jgi:hypothetical protein
LFEQRFVVVLINATAMVTGVRARFVGVGDARGDWSGGRRRRRRGRGGRGGVFGGAVDELDVAPDVGDRSVITPFGSEREVGEVVAGNSLEYVLE